MLLMQSLSLLGDTNDGNNSDNIYIRKKLLLARIVLVMGFQVWPKVQKKMCWRTLLPCPSTGSKIDCASQFDFWVDQKCNCTYCCSKNEFTVCNHFLVWHKLWFAHLLGFRRKHTPSPRIMRFPLTWISTYADFSLCMYSWVNSALVETSVQLH